MSRRSFRFPEHWCSANANELGPNAMPIARAQVPTPHGACGELLNLYAALNRYGAPTGAPFHDRLRGNTDPSSEPA